MEIRFGANADDDVVAAAAAGRAARFSYRVIAKQAALKDQQLRILQINHTRAKSPRARGASTRRRRSAERPAIRPTRWRRLQAAVANSISRILFRGKMLLMLLLRLAAAPRRGQR